VVKIGGLQFTTGGDAELGVDAAKVRVDGSRAEEEPGCGFLASPKFPPSRLVNALYQVVEPLIMKIT
jgi:hypothetical protein